MNAVVNPATLSITQNVTKFFTTNLRNLPLQAVAIIKPQTAGRRLVRATHQEGTFLTSSHNSAGPTHLSNKPEKNLKPNVHFWFSSGLKFNH